MLYLLDNYILATPAALRPKLWQHSIASRFHGKKLWNSQKLTSAKPIALVIHLRPKSFQSKSGKNKCYTSGCCDEVASITTANTVSTGAIQLSRQQKSKFNQVREYFEFILYYFGLVGFDYVLIEDILIFDRLALGKALKILRDWPLYSKILMCF